MKLNQNITFRMLRPVSVQDLDIDCLWGRAKHLDTNIFSDLQNLSPKCFAPTIIESQADRADRSNNAKIQLIP